MELFLSFLSNISIIIVRMFVSESLCTCMSFFFLSLYIVMFLLFSLYNIYVSLHELIVYVFCLLILFIITKLGVCSYIPLHPT